MRRFWTENSVYEVDPSRSLMRRLGGRSPATPHQGVDGSWQLFAEISPIEVDRPVLVRWEAGPDDVKPRPKATRTSLVVGMSTGESDSVPEWVKELLKRGA